MVATSVVAMGRVHYHDVNRKLRFLCLISNLSGTSFYLLLNVHRFSSRLLFSTSLLCGILKRISRRMGNDLDISWTAIWDPGSCKLA